MKNIERNNTNARKHRTRHMRHTIAETHDGRGWLHREWGRMYTTATAAAAAVHRYEQTMRGVTVVSERVWLPATPTGERIARAIIATQT